jgi:hypothetical protein
MAGNHKTREDRQAQAQYRNEEWAGLSFEQQITALDQRLGVGQGAVKQRARIQAKMEAASKPQKGQKKKAK